MKFFYSLFLFLSLSSWAVSTRNIANLDTLTLYSALPYDHSLPPSFQKEKLKFQGNYRLCAKVEYKKSKNKIRFTPRSVSQQKKGKSLSCILVIKNAKDRILKNVSIEVSSINLHRIAKEISTLLIAVDGVEVKIINNKVIIDGEILFVQDLDRINAVISQYDKQLVESLVKFSVEAQKKLVELIKKKILESEGAQEVTVEAIHNRMVLRGTVESLTQKNNILKLVELYLRWLPEDNLNAQKSVGGAGTGTFTRARKTPSIVDLMVVRPKEKAPKEKEKEILFIRVHYVELKKDFTKGFSFQWTPTLQDGTRVNASYGNGGVVDGITSALTAVIQNFLPKLNWAKTFGFAKILHNATVVVESGKEAAITSITTVPLDTSEQSGSGPVVSSSTTATVTLSVKPRLEKVSRRVSMNANFTVTQPTGRGETSSKIIKTEMWVHDRQTAVVGGLFSFQETKDYNRNPSGQQASPLINLFQGKGYSANASQFVVFITPEVRSNANANSEIKKLWELR